MTKYDTTNAVQDNMILFEECFLDWQKNKDSKQYLEHIEKIKRFLPNLTETKKRPFEFKFEYNGGYLILKLSFDNRRIKFDFKGYLVK